MSVSQDYFSFSNNLFEHEIFTLLSLNVPTIKSQYQLQNESLFEALCFQWGAFLQGVSPPYKSCRVGLILRVVRVKLI